MRVPVWGECDNWASKLLAVHVLTHESMHLAGVIDEAEADCLAAQLDAFVAMHLGAGRKFGRSLAREYWTYYYPAQDSQYRSARCRDAGELDLFPDRSGWPTPHTYPPTLPSRIESFVATARSAERSLSSGGSAVSLTPSPHSFGESRIRPSGSDNG